MNREMLLSSFGIPAAKNRNAIAADPADAAGMQMQNKAYVQSLLKMIYVVREMKTQAKGDMYEDFYPYGEPCMVSDEANWHEFQVKLFEKSQLEQQIRERLVKKI